MNSLLVFVDIKHITIPSVVKFSNEFLILDDSRSPSDNFFFILHLFGFLRFYKDFECIYFYKEIQHNIYFNSKKNYVLLHILVLETTVEMFEYVP